MKYLAVSWILFFCGLTTFAQQQYFLYLQTDNNQPFYVRIGNQVVSSTGDGYALIGKITDSARAVIIGFPRNAISEQQFALPALHRDAGYVMEQSPDKTWTLVNLQSQAVIRSSSPAEEKKNNEVSGEKREDAFSRLLAAAVNDSAVLYNATQAPVVTEPLVAVKTDTVSRKPSAQILADSVGAVAKNKEVAEAKKNLPAYVPASTPPHKTSPPVANTSTPLQDTSATAGTAIPKKSPKPEPVHPRSSAGRPKNRLPVTMPVSTVKGTITMLPEKQPDPRKEKKDTIIMMTDVSRRTLSHPHRETPYKGQQTGSAENSDSLQGITRQITRPPVDNSNSALNKPATREIPLTAGSDKTLPPPSPSAGRPDSAELLPGTPAAITADTLSLASVKTTRPMLIKAAELLTDTSYIAVFIDESAGSYDTIRISIPFSGKAYHAPESRPAVDQKSTVPKEKTPPAAVPAAADSSTLVGTSERPLKDNLMTTMLTTIQPAPAARDSTRDSIAVQPAPGRASSATTKQDSLKRAPAQEDTAARVVMVNSDCHAIATENDIDKLRIKMLMVGSDEERIAVAKKLFKQKCLLVAQVRALSELYRNDEGRYKWFDAAYPYVSDTGEFPELGKLLNDEYYRNRFKAMLRN